MNRCIVTIKAKWIREEAGQRAKSSNKEEGGPLLAQWYQAGVQGVGKRTTQKPRPQGRAMFCLEQEAENIKE